jgi:hypothetical protein
VLVACVVGCLLPLSFEGSGFMRGCSMLWRAPVCRSCFGYK